MAAPLPLGHYPIMRPYRQASGPAVGSKRRAAPSVLGDLRGSHHWWHWYHQHAAAAARVQMDAHMTMLAVMAIWLRRQRLIRIVLGFYLAAIVAAGGGMAPDGCM